MYLNKNILIVDDSPIIRHMIKQLLSEEGYQNVDIAVDGRDAINIFAAKNYHLVLLDYNMPGMNGEEILNYLKTHFPDTVVIILSDQTDRNVVISLMRKAADYIVKDDIEKIKGELNHVFNRCFAYQELVLKNRELMNTLSLRNKKLEEEIKIARNFQKEIYPQNIEASDTFSIHALSKPSETIGGDFFYVLRLDNEHLGIFQADICGHGLQAALLSFTLANAFKTSMNLNGKISARQTVTNLNTQLVKLFPTGSFATGCYLVLNEKDSTISFSGAFETPLLYYKTTSEINELKNGNIVFLGLVDNALIKIEESMINLQKGEKVFLFTDGLVEVKSKEGKRLGNDRIKKIICEHPKESVKSICDILYEEASQFSAHNIFDDITIIGIEKKG